MRGRNVVKFQETRSKVSEKITFQLVVLDLFFVGCKFFGRIEIIF